jgi:Universal stress protein family
MATKTMAAFARILVPTDFSTGSERAWDLAQRLGVSQSAELCLVHVLPATPIDVEARLQGPHGAADRRAVPRDPCSGEGVRGGSRGDRQPRARQHPPTADRQRG